MRDKGERGRERSNEGKDAGERNSEDGIGLGLGGTGGTRREWL